MKKRSNMKSKTWTCLSIVMMFIGLFALALYNYKMDVFCYFGDELTKEWGYSQYSKVKYIKNNPDEYNCFVIGGSNSGVIDPELINEYTGYNTFSMSFNLGNNYSYYDYTQFLIENTEVECIILHLSSTELSVDQESVASDVAYKVPSLTKGGLDYFKEVMEVASTSIVSQEESYHHLKRNGQLDWQKFIDDYKADPVQYVNIHVLSNFDEKLIEFGNAEIEEDLVETNLEYMHSIVELCDENNVKLIVVNGPVFISKRSDFECNAYYNYLEELVTMTDVWDFSGFSSVNANPHNFYDLYHYNANVADTMIDCIFNDDILVQDFGVLLTKDNITDYLYQRKKDFEDMKEELALTGTIQCETYDAPSRLECSK